MLLNCREDLIFLVLTSVRFCLTVLEGRHSSAQELRSGGFEFSPLHLF